MVMLSKLLPENKRSKYKRKKELKGIVAVWKWALDDMVICNWAHKIKFLIFLFVWLVGCSFLYESLMNYDEICKQTHKTKKP